MSEVGEIDYAAALRQVGFDEGWVARGVARRAWEVDEGMYDGGFRGLVMRLRIAGAHSVLREHHVEPVVRRVEAREAAAQLAQLAQRGAASSLRVAAGRAEDACQRLEQGRTVMERNLRMRELLAQMTNAEFEGRARMRPEIAEAYCDLFPER